MWYHQFDTYIQELRSKISQVNHYVYSKQVGDHFVYVALYVNDMSLVVNNIHLIEELKQQLLSNFDMKDIRELHFILGMEIKRNQAKKKL